MRFSRANPIAYPGGFSLGPHLLISDTALQRTGLVTLGSLIEYAYRVAAPSSSTEEFRHAAIRAFPNAGWEIRTRDNPTPGTRSFIDQVTMFLTLAGLTVLAVGGVGAGQSISAFLDRMRTEIAIFKSLGADGALIFAAFFIQIMAIATLAVFVGAVLGALVPFLVETLYGANLPIPAALGLYPKAFFCWRAHSVRWPLPPFTHTGRWRARARSRRPACSGTPWIATAHPFAGRPFLHPGLQVLPFCFWRLPSHLRNSLPQNFWVASQAAC